jgi:antitoxin Xre/MbcA/ParS-like protein
MKRKRTASADQVRELAAPAYQRATPGAPARPLFTHVDQALHARVGGNLDARRIAARLGVPPKRLAPAVGYTPQGLLKNPTSDKLQPALGELAYVLTNLRSLLDDDRSVSIWLRAPHPDLGGATPLSFMLSGRTAAVIALLHLAESGQTS